MDEVTKEEPSDSDGEQQGGEPSADRLSNRWRVEVPGNMTLRQWLELENGGSD